MTGLAKQLWEARAAGYTIDAAEFDLPSTLAEAYAVQEAVCALSGFRRAGYKVGSTSEEAQCLLGTAEPDSGVLLQPYVYESPAKIAIVSANMPSVEGEFAFRMARDLPPRDAPYTLTEVADAIDCVTGAIEIVGTRFSGGLSGKGRLLTTADCGVNIAVILGQWVLWQSQDLRPHTVTMTVNAIKKGEGTGSRAMGDPLRVLLWLANHQVTRRMGLTEGEIILTGTCTGLDAVYLGDHVEADFGSLGRVEVFV